MGVHQWHRDHIERGILSGLRRERQISRVCLKHKLLQKSKLKEERVGKYLNHSVRNQAAQVRKSCYPQSEPACFPCDPRKHQHRLNTDCPGSGWAHTDLGPCFTSLEGNLTMLVPTGAQHHAGPLAQEATHPKM